MSTIDARPSGNGRGSEAWSRSWTHFTVDRVSLGLLARLSRTPAVSIASIRGRARGAGSDSDLERSLGRRVVESLAEA